MNDDGLRLGKEYVKYISSIDNLQPSVLLYGSTVYGKVSSKRGRGGLWNAAQGNRPDHGEVF